MPRHEIHVMRYAEGVCPAFKKDDDRKVEVRIAFFDKGKRFVSFNNHSLSTFLDRLYRHLKYEVSVIESVESLCPPLTEEQEEQWFAISEAMGAIAIFEKDFLRTYKSVDWGSGCYPKHWNKLINYLKPWLYKAKTI